MKVSIGMLKNACDGARKSYRHAFGTRKTEITYEKAYDFAKRRRCRMEVKDNFWWFLIRHTSSHVARKFYHEACGICIYEPVRGSLAKITRLFVECATSYATHVEAAKRGWAKRRNKDV